MVALLVGNHEGFDQGGRQSCTGLGNVLEAVLTRLYGRLDVSGGRREPRTTPRVFLEQS